MTEPELYVNLDFVNADLRNQIKHSREVLEQVRRLREALALVDNNPQAQKKIQETIDGLLKTVNEMTANVMTTSSSASTATALFTTTPRAKTEK